MNTEPLESLDELIAEEKRLVAEELLLEAWEAAEQDGIDRDILARAFGNRLLKKLTKEFGPLAATQFLTELTEQNEAGDFIAQKTLQ